MEYQTENNDKYQSSNLYQATRSPDNQFLDDVLRHDLISPYDTIKHFEEQIDRHSKVRDEIRELNMHYFWAKVEYCYFGRIQPQVSYFGIPFEQKGRMFLKDES